MSKFLFWLTGYLPLRVISDGEKPYLERYYLCTLLGYRFYIHRFVGSDPDRGLHDHPWKKAYSIILSGYYFEENRMGGKRVRWFNSLTGDTFHRVVLPFAFVDNKLTNKQSPCWTLFFHTARDVKRWGFWRPLRTQLPYCEQMWIPYPHPHSHRKEGGKETEWWKTAKRRGQE